MKESMATTKKQRQRKMLLVLPILAVPFLTVFFWSLGGGKSSARDKPVQKIGLNQSLPETAVPENGFSKLNYYDRADEDSSRQQNLRNKDPFFMTDKTKGEGEFDYDFEDKDRLVKSYFHNPHEEKVMDQLRVLQQAVSKPPISSDGRPELNNRKTSYNVDADIKRLETIAASMDAPAEEDREMQQINGMLENILDIQHPQRVQERMKKEKRIREGAVSNIAQPIKENIIGYLANDISNSGAESVSNGFFSEESENQTSDYKNAITAVIAESQVCVNGSIIKLRLSQEILIGGVRIPKNTYVYGTVSLKGERLTLEINSIRHQNSVFPVELLLYDMDGLEGIYIPGAVSRDVAKASAERSIQPLGITSLDDSWGAQAAGAGVEAAKSLLSKKVKLVKVTVKAGYQVLLKEKKTNNN